MIGRSHFTLLVLGQHHDEALDHLCGQLVAPFEGAEWERHPVRLPCQEGA